MHVEPVRNQCTIVDKYVLQISSSGVRKETGYKRYDASKSHTNHVKAVTYKDVSLICELILH